MALWQNLGRSLAPTTANTRIARDSTPGTDRPKGRSNRAPSQISVRDLPFCPRATIMPLTADDRVALVQQKIERAKGHITDLRRAVAAFLRSSPYEVATKRDPQTRRLIYYVSSVKPTPLDLATITGDVVQNLRSALDHLAQQLFLVGTSGGAGAGRHIYFPIERDAASYRSNFRRKLRGIRQNAIDVLGAIEPYKGGKGHEFWVLQELNNTDKHRLLVTVGSSFQSVNVGPHLAAMLKRVGDSEPPHVELFLEPANNLCPLKAGDELFIDAVDAEVNPKTSFRFTIALSEPGIVDGKPLLEMVDKFAGLVSDIVLRFKPYLA